MRVVEEAPDPGEVPLWRHPEWHARFPWLVQATTGAGADGSFDLGLFGEQPTGRAMDRWSRVRVALGMPTAVHSRQVHGAEISWHREALPPGLLVTDGYDAHVTRTPGVLLSVSIADCVPVTVVDARRRAVVVAHAGWRGTAAGVLGRGLAALVDDGSAPADLHVHMGPAICGACYEVGPEVHAAVRPRAPVPPEATPIDLRAALGERALDAGVPADQVTVSAHCTRCGPGDFFSHRGGSALRQMGLVGVRG